ncbi:MAG: phage terminase large subunit [Deferribacterales bacterium]|nr:phage terminase large subunit [Deferribacterales bacterium]
MFNKQPYPPLPEKLRDFRVFLVTVWRSLGLDDPTPIQLDIAKYLAQGGRRKAVQAFRGVGKSWITSAYVMWRLRLNPDLKFLVVSAGKERADNFTTFCMRLMSQVEVLKCMMPNKYGRSSKSSFDTAGSGADHAPSVKSVGIFGQLTGTRADEIIADDVETAVNSLTFSARERLSEAVKEFDAIIKPGGIITYLGTPQTEQSLYNLLTVRGYEKRVWPAKYPHISKIQSYGGGLAPLIEESLKTDPQLAEAPTDPRRFSAEDLAERELSYGKSGFALQFMLDTVLTDEERCPLKLRDLIVADLDKDSAPEEILWSNASQYCLDLPSVGMGGDGFYSPSYVSLNTVPYTSRVMAIDPSGRGRDETAYAVIYERDGYLFLMESGGLKDGYSALTMQTLAKRAKEHNVNAVIIEGNFGDGMFKELLTPVLFGCGVKAQISEVRHHTMKEARIIDVLEPVMACHRLIVNVEVVEKDYYLTSYGDGSYKYMLFYQMSHIMRESAALAHDDRLDALAIGVGYFVQRMSQDRERKSKQRREREFQRELDVFVHGRGGFGIGYKGLNYFPSNLVALAEDKGVKVYTAISDNLKDIRNRR